jgi:hypothetical protein
MCRQHGTGYQLACPFGLRTGSRQLYRPLLILGVWPRRLADFSRHLREYLLKAGATCGTLQRVACYRERPTLGGLPGQGRLAVHKPAV